MDKSKYYKIIGNSFGAPPIGSVMSYSETHEAYTVKGAYNLGTGLHSIYTGDPANEPEICEKITKKEYDEIILEKRKQLPYNCSNCGNYAFLNSAEAGSEREILRLCPNCYQQYLAF